MAALGRGDPAGDGAARRQLDQRGGGHGRGRLGPGVKGADLVAIDRVAHDHPDRRAEGHGDQQPDKAEQRAEDAERQHQPDRVQPDMAAHDLGLKVVPFQHLPRDEDARDGDDPLGLSPEGEQRDADRDHAAHQRAHIGNEGQRGRRDADDDAEGQPGQRQPDRVEDGQDQDHHRLPPHEARDAVVDLAGKPPQRVQMGARKQRVDAAHHPVPVQQHVEGHDRRDDQHHHEADHAVDRPHDGADDGAHAGCDGRARLLQRVVHEAAVREQVGIAALHHGLKAVDHGGRRFDKLRALPDQQRHQPDQRGRQRQDGQPGDQHDGQHARHARAFQPVHHGIKKIGDRHAQHEGHDRGAQKPEDQRQDQRHRPPPDGLLAAGKPHCACSVLGVGR